MCRSRQLRTNQPTGDLLTHSESLGSRSPDHRGIIRSQILEQASHLRLTFVVNQRVGGREQRASRSSRGEPVASSESSEKREEVGLHMSSGEERGDLVDRVGGLTWRSNRVVQRNVSRGSLWPSTLLYVLTFSLTRVSSTAAKFSRGPKIKYAHSLPPTYSENPPSSSARTNKTSSSSSS